jgi:lipopolysaccharide transport system ATP-binding protein
MSSDAIAVRVAGLGKRYEMYPSPAARLKQFVVPRLRRAMGLPSAPYYQEFWALRDVSFEIAKGEAFGVVGRNGSGKSTLLQLITGTLAPTTGSVETNGRVAALLELGSGFNPDFTGRENVFLNGMVLGLTRREIEARFDDIAAFADIGEHLERPTRTYSSGMLVRLAFAVQVQVEPDILIVDEALAVGDALFQKRCYERIEKLLRNGTTVLFVSHDQETVRTLTRRAMLLKDGACVALGSSSDVLLAYRRQLHEEETSYFGKLASLARGRAPAVAAEPPAAAAGGEPAGTGRTSALSFGDGGVHIVAVTTSDDAGQPCSMFETGATLRVRITCRADIAIDRLNVAMRIRSREGIKVYSWGTLNQDMRRLREGGDQALFWRRSFTAGTTFAVDFACNCALGANLYEIQACVSYEAEPDYTAQRILHWVDEAAFFQVTLRRDQLAFGGLVDLAMRADWTATE